MQRLNGRRLWLIWILFVLTFITLSVASGEETPFDDMASFHFDPIEEITDIPVYCSLTPEEIAASNDDIVRFIGYAWYNLYDYEQKHGNEIEEPFSEGIREGLTNSPGIAAFTAIRGDAEYANVLIAVNTEYAGKWYWIEWNLKNQSMRATVGKGVEHYVASEEFLIDYVFNSYLVKSVGGNSLTDLKLPEGSIVKAYVSETEISKVFDQAVSAMADNKRGESESPVAQTAGEKDEDGNNGSTSDEMLASGIIELQDTPLSMHDIFPIN